MSFWNRYSTYVICRHKYIDVYFLVKKKNNKINKSINISDSSYGESCI